MSEKRDQYVAIIDYKMGNLFSVKQACEQVGIKAIVTEKKEEILNASGLILPGVGGFGDAMQHLRDLDLIEVIRDEIAAGKPLLGICLGLQLLMSESEEFGSHEGLGLIEGKVKKFKLENSEGRVSKVPQVGWNQIASVRTKQELHWNQTPLQHIKEDDYLYFVHSYFVEPTLSDVVLSQSTYEGVSFCSSVLKDNIFAVQFHPEKSASVGLQIYKNWFTQFCQEPTNKEMSRVF